MTYELIILVTGCRRGVPRRFVTDRLDQVLGDLVPNRVLLVNGQADGVDTFANSWAADKGVQPIRMPALWDHHRSAAGPIRNKHMVEVTLSLRSAFPTAITIVEAFPIAGSLKGGTRDCMRQAFIAGLTINTNEYS